MSTASSRTAVLIFSGMVSTDDLPSSCPLRAESASSMLTKHSSNILCFSVVVFSSNRTGSLVVTFFLFNPMAVSCFPLGLPLVFILGGSVKLKLSVSCAVISSATSTVIFSACLEIVSLELFFPLLLSVSVLVSQSNLAIPRRSPEPSISVVSSTMSIRVYAAGTR